MEKLKKLESQMPIRGLFKLMQACKKTSQMLMPQDAQKFSDMFAESFDKAD